MKKLAFVLASATALISAPALAADLGRMPVKAPVAAAVAPFNWSGFYLGAFAGGAFAAARDGGDVVVVETGPATYNNLIPFAYDLESSFIAGGTIGYNFQAPGSPLVFGIEGEVGYLRLRGAAAQPGSPALDTVSATRIGDWYGIIAGRLGFAFDRALIYVKGGGAFIDRTVDVIDTCNTGLCGPALVNATGKSDDITWTVGAGVEFALAPNWSIKAEYLYIDTRDTILAVGNAVPGGAAVSWAHSLPGLHTAKIGVNFRFGGAPIVASY